MPVRLSQTETLPTRQPSKLALGLVRMKARCGGLYFLEEEYVMAAEQSEWRQSLEGCGTLR